MLQTLKLSLKHIFVVLLLIRCHFADKNLLVLIRRAIPYHMVHVFLHFLSNLAVNIAIFFVEVANPVDTRPNIRLVIKEQHS